MKKLIKSIVDIYNKLVNNYTKLKDSPIYKKLIILITNKKFISSLTYIIFPLIILGLGFLVVQSILQPVRFDNELKYRESVAIERLKSIRTLQDAYKTENGKFTSTLDSLVDFYDNGQITIVRQVGSFDDSLAVAQKLVFRDSVRIAVRDTLLNKIPNFIADSLKYIPFSGGQLIAMDATVKSVSGVEVPLFEATIPYMNLLMGMNYQLIINLCAQREDLNRYAGLRVGSIANPNNNAGNWE